jgi:hypothetical protein
VIYQRPPPDHIDEDGDALFEVNRIVKKRYRKRGNRRVLQYLVLWKGYPDHEGTWEPADRIKRDAPLVVDDFESAQ